MRNWAGYVKVAREHARLSRSGLADKIGVSYATVWRWETGKQSPENAAVVARFAEVTGVDLNEALAAAGLRPGEEAPEQPTIQERPLDPVLAEVQRLLDHPGISDEAKAGYRALLHLMVERQPHPDQPRQGRKAS